MGSRSPQLVIDASRPFGMKKDGDQLVKDASSPFSIKKGGDSWTKNQTVRGTHVSLLGSLDKHPTGPYQYVKFKCSCLLAANINPPLATDTGDELHA